MAGEGAYAVGRRVKAGLGALTRGGDERRQDGGGVAHVARFAEVGSVSHLRDQFVARATW